MVIKKVCTWCKAFKRQYCDVAMVRGLSVFDEFPWLFTIFQLICGNSVKLKNHSNSQSLANETFRPIVNPFDKSTKKSAQTPKSHIVEYYKFLETRVIFS